MPVFGNWLIVRTRRHNNRLLIVRESDMLVMYPIECNQNFLLSRIVILTSVTLSEHSTPNQVQGVNVTALL